MMRFLQLNGFLRGRKAPVVVASDALKVSFDEAVITPEVMTDIRACIAELPDIPRSYQAMVYEAAVRSVSRGRDLHTLTNAITAFRLNDMDQRRAGEIALLINNRATAIIARARQTNLGVTEAIWLYSGAPCHPADSSRHAAFASQDEAHRAANGGRFRIEEGMYLNGRWTWPGREEGCKCVSRSVIPGFA